MIGPGAPLVPLAPFVPLAPAAPCLPAAPWMFQRTFFHPFGHFFFAALPVRSRISPDFFFTHAVNVAAFAADADTSTAQATQARPAAAPNSPYSWMTPSGCLWWDYAKDMSDGARASRATTCVTGASTMRAMRPGRSIISQREEAPGSVETSTSS